MSVIKKYNAKYQPEKKIKYSSNGISFTDTRHKERMQEEPNQLEIHLEELEKVKTEIIEATKLEADKMFKKAKADAKKIKKDAFAEGHDEGYVRGYEEGFEKSYNERQQELEKELADLANVKEHYAKIYQDYIYHAEEDIVEIIISLTEKLVGEKLEINKSIINNLVIEAIEKCAKKDKIVARISKANFPIVEANKEAIISKISGLDSLKIVADESLSNFEILVETPYGDISNCLKSKLSDIKESLKSMIKQLRNDYN